MSNLANKYHITSSAIVYWLVITLLAYGFTLSSENLYNQMPVISSWLDQTLYNQDFYIQEMGGFTPRFYYYSLIYFPVKLGADITATFFVYYVASFFSFCLAVRAIGKLFYASEFSSAILLFLCLSVTNGTIGDVDIYRTEPIPAIYAMGISIWGIYYCFQKQWNKGYLLFGISCLMQILIGLIPGILFFPLLFKDTLLKRDIKKVFTAPSILLIFILSIYLPMKILGGTSTKLIDNQDFIFLYGYIRHPHHIIYSSFGIENWLNLFCFFFSAAIVLKMSNRFSREIKLDFFILFLFGLLILVAGYIFVEFIQIPLIAKMQLPRVTPFIQIIALIVFSSLIQDELRKPIWSIVLLGLMSITVNYGSFLIPVFFLVINAYKQSRTLKNYEYLISFILITIYTSLSIDVIYLPILFLIQFSLCLIILSDQCNSYSSSKKQLILLVASSIIFIIFMILFRHRRLLVFIAIISPFIFQQLLSGQLFRKIFFNSISIVLSAFLLLGYLQALPSNALNSFQMTFKLPRDDDGDLIRIARRLNETSHTDALVLVPPSDLKFRFFSQKSIVFTDKSFPFTDRGILEWWDRYQTIVGKVTEDLDLAYQNYSSTELMEIGNYYGADYILSRKSWHLDLEGDLVDTEGEWDLWFIKTKK